LQKEKKKGCLGPVQIPGFYIRIRSRKKICMDVATYILRIWTETVKLPGTRTAKAATLGAPDLRNAKIRNLIFLFVTVM